MVGTSSRGVTGVTDRVRSPSATASSAVREIGRAVLAQEPEPVEDRGRAAGHAARDEERREAADQQGERGDDDDRPLAARRAGRGRGGRRLAELLRLRLDRVVLLDELDDSGHPDAYVEAEDAGDEDYPPEGGRRKRRGRSIPGCLAALVALALIAGGAYVAVSKGAEFIRDQFSTAADYPGPGRGKVTFEVESGDTVGQIGRNLKAKGVVQSVDAFIEASNGESGISSLVPDLSETWPDLVFADDPDVRAWSEPVQKDGEVFAAAGRGGKADRLVTCVTRTARYVLARRPVIGRERSRRDPEVRRDVGTRKVEHALQACFGGEKRSWEQIENVEAGFHRLSTQFAEGCFGVERDVDRTEFATRVEPPTRAEAGQQGAVRYLCVSWRGLAVDCSGEGGFTGACRHFSSCRNAEVHSHQQPG